LKIVSTSNFNAFATVTLESWKKPNKRTQKLSVLKRFMPYAELERKIRTIINKWKKNQKNGVNE